MTTLKYAKNCDLCRLPVEIKGFTLKGERGLLSFCCAGCQSIYQLIYMNRPSSDIHKTNINKEEN
ncbi:heavy metal translocating P-type ATPase metal-binding domain-containing protein [Methyloglobulus sp.]|uniref:heavy metal translocating P-type ATPase metal-binding domain-containing protein n=1 Tax=Methyloglobulus sp. TaxID=2518622 RepID=UPI0032B71D9E